MLNNLSLSGIFIFRYHPDTNKSNTDTKKFQEVSEAYEVKKKITFLFKAYPNFV